MVGSARAGGWLDPDSLGHRDGQLVIDVVELLHLPLRMCM
jgi:hypothetical protein